MQKFCQLDKEGLAMIRMAVERMGLTARADHRVLKFRRNVKSLHFHPVTTQPVTRLLDAHAGNFEATLRTLVVERVDFAKRHPSLIAMAGRETSLRPAFRTVAATFFSPGDTASS